MKRIAFTIFTIFLALMVTAKDYNHELSGRVQDAVFGDPLAAKLTLMTSDSVVILNCSTHIIMRQRRLSHLGQSINKASIYGRISIRSTMPWLMHSLSTNSKAFPLRSPSA